MRKERREKPISKDEALAMILSHVPDLQSSDPDSLWNRIKEYNDVTPTSPIHIMNGQLQTHFAFWGSGGAKPLEFLEIRGVDCVGKGKSRKDQPSHGLLIAFGDYKEGGFEHIITPMYFFQTGYYWRGSKHLLQVNIKNWEDTSKHPKQLSRRFILDYQDNTFSDLHYFDNYADDVIQIFPLSHKEGIRQYLRDPMEREDGNVPIHDFQLTDTDLRFVIPNFYKGQDLPIIIPTDLRFDMKNPSATPHR